MAAKQRGVVRHAMAAAVVMAIASGPLCPATHAGIADGVVSGVSDIVMGAFALPLDVLAGTFSGPPIIGTVGGVLRGAFRTVGLGLRGALKLVGVAIPVTAKAAPLIPIFL